MLHYAQATYRNVGMSDKQAFTIEGEMAVYVRYSSNVLRIFVTIVLVEERYDCKLYE